MTRENITLIKLEASAGMVLTNGESCGRTIYLGAEDRAENWHEITESEYEAMCAAEDEAPADDA